jgi:hypothetical protein
MTPTLGPRWWSGRVRAATGGQALSDLLAKLQQAEPVVPKRNAYTARTVPFPPAT